MSKLSHKHPLLVVPTGGDKKAYISKSNLHWIVAPAHVKSEVRRVSLLDIDITIYHTSTTTYHTLPAHLL